MNNNLNNKLNDKDNANEIEIKIETKITDALREEVFQLYLEGNWWKKDDRKNIHLIDEVIKNSFCFVAAFSQKKLIGMGRVISDGLSDAYIQDIIVTKSFRGKGIGKSIVKKIVDHLKEKKVAWIALIAQPGTSSFYTDLGFKEMKDYTPMLLED
ncbi:MAG: GNAT family N-acetyltransferase [Oligoflexia bacterium]|nr:GNAT family N-acetyltransferase [Oligoflexia bacterium]